MTEGERHASVQVNKNFALLLILGLFLMFINDFYRASFCPVLASFCEAQLCPCVHNVFNLLFPANLEWS